MRSQTHATWSRSRTAANATFCWSAFLVCLLLPWTAAQAAFQFIDEATSVGGIREAWIVRTGDFNEDGRPDLLVGISGETRLLLNPLEGGSRSGAWEALITPIPPSATLEVGDFNHDSHLDVASLGSGRLRLFVGDGEQHFRESFDGGVQPGNHERLLAADVNGDTQLDFISYDGPLWKVHIYYGDGAGGITRREELTSRLVQGGRCFVEDLDADGRADILLAGYEQAAADIFLGRTTGGFEAPVRVDLGMATEDTRLLDLNGDGIADLLTYGWYVGTSKPLVALQPGLGGGRFGPPEVRVDPVDDAVFQIRIVELTGDGYPDLLLQTMQQTLWICDGEPGGHFAAARPLLGFSPIAEALAMADLDGDGHVDLAAGLGSGGMLNLLWGDGRGELQSPALETVLPPSSHLRLTDLDGNGTPDLVGSSLLEGLTARRNDGSGKFGPVENWSPGFRLEPWGAVDLENDGSPELLVSASDLETGPMARSVGLLRGMFGGLTPAITALPIGMVVGYTRFVDLNGDGRQDIFVRERPPYGTDAPARAVILTGLGGGDFAPPEVIPTLAIPAGGWASPISTGDLNLDGRMDFLELRPGKTLQVWLGGETPADLHALPPAIIDSRWFEIVALSDVDQDGLPDLLLRTEAGVSLARGHGDGTFGGSTVVLAGDTFVSAGLADLDQDGLDDIVTTDYRGIVMTVKPGFGLGVFGDPIMLQLAASGSILGLADMDGDRRRDVVLLDVEAAQSRVRWIKNVSEAPTPEPPSVSLTGRRDGLSVVLEWEHHPLNRAAAYMVDRLQGSEAIRLTAHPVIGAGRVTFRTPDVTLSAYTYRLSELTGDNSERTVGEVAVPGIADEPVEPPAILDLRVVAAQGHHVRLTLSLPQRALTQLRVVDVSGRLVRTLLDEEMPAGEREVTWDGLDRAGRPVVSGIYLIQAQTSDMRISRRVTLLP